ncbi:MAG: PEP-CTERM sorting domain-containing protein [Cyanobacteria bacterium J06623_7]
MFKKLSIALITVASSAAMGGTAQAISLTSGEWTGFSFGGVGSSTPSFDFVVTEGGGKLKVTDAAFAGDIFQVSNNGSVLGSTSSVSPNDGISILDPNAAFLSPLFSSGSFSLGEGAQSIVISPTASPFGGGDGFIRYDQVPEPLTILGSLTAIGMGALLKREYSRKQKLAK